MVSDYLDQLDATEMLPHVLYSLGVEGGMCSNDIGSISEKVLRHSAILMETHVENLFTRIEMITGRNNLKTKLNFNPNVEFANLVDTTVNARVALRKYLKS